MPDIFLILALIFAVIAGLLFFAADRKLLNFVDYGQGEAVRRLNRYAALRMLVPVAVSLLCSVIAGARPALTVPLLFLTPIAVLCVVVWVGVGAGRLARQAAPAGRGRKTS